MAGMGLIMGMAACDQLNRSIKDTFEPESRENNSQPFKRPFATKGGDDFLTNASRLQEAERALRALPAFAGKTIYLYRHIHFYADGRINVKIQHPENKSFVDEYNFAAGSWKAPQPVQLSVRDNIREGLISLDTLKFASVAGLYKSYTAKADSIQGAPALTHVYAIIQKNNFQWYPRSISGSRERYFISFKHDGSLDRFYQE